MSSEEIWRLYVKWRDMRHKWENYYKKIDEKLKERSSIKFLDVDGKRQIIQNCKECIHCGLRRGTSRTIGYLPTTVYFKDEELLSLDVLPYKCYDKKEEGFLSEGDFYIDV